MRIDEVLIFSGVIMVLLLIFIVVIFMLFTKKTIENINQSKEFDLKMQQAIILSQESEREALADNLHDDFGPQLGMLYRHLQKEVDSSSSITLSASDRDNIYKKLDLLIVDVRNYSSQIFPRQLAELGLINAIEQNLSNLGFNIRIGFFNRLIYDLNFDQPKQLAIYRITNEILNNIIRHGKPTFIECELNNEEDKFQVVFTHDGAPFSQKEFLETARNNEGRGCSSILNRTLQLEGTIEFYRILDQYACTKLQLPLK